MMEAGSGSGHQTSPNVVCQLVVLGVAGQHGQAGGGRGQVALYQVVGHLRVISFRVRIP